MQLAALGHPPQCIARFSGARLALGCSLDGVLAKRHDEPRTLERGWLGLAGWLWHCARGDPNFGLYQVGAPPGHSNPRSSYSLSLLPSFY